MSATEIVRLSVETLDIPLIRPFGISGGAQAVANNLLVTVELADGTLGFGEAAPLPPFNGETQAGSETALEPIRLSLLGRDARSWRAIAKSISDLVKDAGAARCATETAILDALTKRAGMSLLTFFGGVERSLETDVTITIGSIDEAKRETASWAEQGFRTFKIKVGSGDVALDEARVVAVHEASRGASIFLDGNAGMTEAEALTLVRALQARGVSIAYFEQPVARDDLEGLARVGRLGEVAIVADESAASPADVFALATSRAARVVNIKLMKSGIAGALDIAAVARASGLDLMIGGMVESKLAMSTSACFAGGLGGFRVVDLDTPLFLAEERFDGGFIQHGPSLDLGSIAAGHGAVPRG